MQEHLDGVLGGAVAEVQKPRGLPLLLLIAARFLGYSTVRTAIHASVNNTYAHERTVAHETTQGTGTQLFICVKMFTRARGPGLCTANAATTWQLSKDTRRRREGSKCASATMQTAANLKI